LEEEEELTVRSTKEINPYPRLFPVTGSQMIRDSLSSTRHINENRLRRETKKEEH